MLLWQVSGNSKNILNLVSLEQHADTQQRLLHDHDLRGDPVGFPGQLTIRAGRNYVHNFQQVDYEDGAQSRKPHYSEVTSLVRGKYVACGGLATPSRVHNRNHLGCSAILAQGRGTPEQVTAEKAATAKAAVNRSACFRHL